MRFSISIRLLFLAITISLLPATVNASPSLISIGDFLTPSGMPSPEFKNVITQQLTEAGLSCANCTESSPKSRYKLSGLMVKDDKGTSFSALLTDNFHLEPDVFIKGKQIGGTSSKPAARELAESAAELISNQSVASIEVSGDSRMTPNAVMALAQILPGEDASPQKIIAARIILENCGLFEKVRIYLTPGPEGRKVKISVRERDSILPANMPGPGKAVLDNILGPQDTTLPEFPAITEKRFPGLSNATCGGYLAYRAESILARMRNNDHRFNVDDVEELVAVAASIRNNISTYDASCRDMCIILMKLCSMLDSQTIRTISEKLQQNIELTETGPHTLEKNLERIEFITQAYGAAQEAQLILSSRIFHDRIHSPVVPWILYSLGEQALQAEDITRAAPLLSGAIAVSSLPVSPEMLLTTAMAQYSNLDIESGGAAGAQLKPLLANPDLESELRRQISSLPRRAELCETATSITGQDSFELQLKKGNALILLDRPDLAEPLFHKLHGLRPDDARPFTGFGRLAFQRTENLLSVRPYLERAEHMKNKDRFFYELALAYKLERIIAEALPTIRIDGRNSEEASATRFLLPKTLEYAQGYERFNRPQAKLIKAGVDVLGEWLAYPAMSTAEAFDNMFRQTLRLDSETGNQPEILAASLYFSTNSTDRTEARKLISRPMSVKAGLKPRFLQLNLLIREMALTPSAELSKALEQAGRSSFSDTESREEAVALKADALAVAGLYTNSASTLERAESLYTLAVDLNEGNNGRLLNNLACVNLALGRVEEADDLYDEALDSYPEAGEVVEMGKLVSSLSGEERMHALEKFAAKNISQQLKGAAIKLNGTSNSTAGPESNSSAGMMGIYLNENRKIVTGYDNYTGLSIIFKYKSNIWLLPTQLNTAEQSR
ncbi:cyclic nucleotide-binding protein [Desulfovibrio sp. JC022]|uniref:cyclic nucleotide-binding protein n=1 Tax=Desulfovibrio sp. JC022 TaxID=2593642 RepID=UPI0013D4C3D4|nr:cyclic nucleotide-binding protein [Desulfovibrio sp. JC022]NDV23994.1 cyclic nucleotide-binding protein [Desulfovibrio sp. JC022]